jgi:threonylcarbamoyladenosine tRNA methylthiotransferase CDKAL1
MVWQVLIKNYGCSTNMADGEVLAGCLVEAGFKLATSESEADVLIFNTCAVKGPTENRIIDTLKRAPKDKKIIVAGCLPKISFERLLREVRFDGVVDPAVGKAIVNVVSRVVAGERAVDLSTVHAKPLLNLPRVNINQAVSIVPISYGCLGNCAYCCVRFARGRLRSYGILEVVDRVQADFAAGAKEFWITSQDTACFGRDLGIDLAELLQKLCGLQGDFWLRIGMMTPNMVTDMQGRLIRAFGSEKVFKFLHLPVQSGDDAVLAGMHRYYTTTDFKRIVSAFRAEFPNLTLATDVIVGFPGETAKAFENTLTLLKQIKPDVVNVSKFFARPKTEASMMQNGLVEQEEIKRRSTLTAKLAKKLSAVRKRRGVGWAGEVLVDEQGKVEGTWVGHNFAYKPIVVESHENLLGKDLKVKVTEAHGTYLKGELNMR